MMTLTLLIDPPGQPAGDPLQAKVQGREYTGSPTFSNSAQNHIHSDDKFTSKSTQQVLDFENSPSKSDIAGDVHKMGTPSSLAKFKILVQHTPLKNSPKQDKENEHTLDVESSPARGMSSEHS